MAVGNSTFAPPALYTLSDICRNSRLLSPLNAAGVIVPWNEVSEKSISTAKANEERDVLVLLCIVAIGVSKVRPFYIPRPHSL